MRTAALFVSLSLLGCGEPPDDCSIEPGLWTLTVMAQKGENCADRMGQVFWVSSDGTLASLYGVQSDECRQVTLVSSGVCQMARTSMEAASVSCAWRLDDGSTCRYDFDGKLWR